MLCRLPRLGQCVPPGRDQEPDAGAPQPPRAGGMDALWDGPLCRGRGRIVLSRAHADAVAGVCDGRSHLCGVHKCDEMAVRKAELGAVEAGLPMGWHIHSLSSCHPFDID